MAVKRGMRSLGDAITRRTGMTTGHMAAIGGSVWAGTSEYQRARDEGAGTGGALLRGAAEGVLVDLLGLPLYFSFTAARGLPGAVTSGMESMAEYSRGLQRERPGRPFQNNTFMDTQQTYTMRQAGMQLAQQSRHNLQHAMLGNEASHMHR